MMTVTDLLLHRILRPDVTASSLGEFLMQRRPGNPLNAFPLRAVSQAE
jgi:hypothetical protein